VREGTKKLIPSFLSLTLQDTEALARKIAAAGGGRVELGEIKWRWDKKDK